MEVCHVGVFSIAGGRRLRGEVTIGGAKNALLPILAATMLTGGEVILDNCARLSDCENMLRILRTLGCAVERRDESVCVDSRGAQGWEMSESLSKQLRSSIFMLGPILGRFRKASVTYPGGCEIGLRPIDLHLKGLRALGVEIHEARGRILCDGSRLHGGEVQLDFPSVGATENVMMAAVLAPGETVISNAAREPEIVDLQNFLRVMGAKVHGAGQDVISIEGVKKLHGARYAVMPDRIVAGTLLAAAAITHGEVCLKNARPDDLRAVLDKLSQAGCLIESGADFIRLSAEGRALRAVNLSTQPYPGFPTDMQAQFMALCTVAEGTSLIVENVFENRFAHAAQLRRMGADILVHQRAAIVRGGSLSGAQVEARDLRGGAALVLAALAAEGESRVERVELIDRGYEALETTLADLGASIRREEQTGEEEG